MKKFYKTVFIVTLFSVCEKFLGFLYRIYLSRAVGAEGVGIYQVALSVFGLIFTVICSGTPITVSRLMTKYNAEGNLTKKRKVITAGICFTLGLSLPVCLLFFAFSSKLSFIFADDRCLPVFLIILPGLIFTSVYSVLRGVFWGNKDFLPYSVTELLEEACMIIVGVVLISNSSSVFQGAFSAGVAVLISYIFSFTLALTIFFIRKNKLVNPVSEFKPLLSSALPVTAMRSVNSLSSSLLSIVLPMRLIYYGFTESSAITAFGSAVGQAMPLLSIPTSLIGSFILVMVPEISENFYSKNNLRLKSDIEKALKFTCFLSCLFVPLFTVMGEEIGTMVFNSYECGKFLSKSAFLMIFMGLLGITTSILNSIGGEKRVLVYTAICGGLMLLSVWFLPSVMGINSLIVGYFFAFGLTTILNLLLMYKLSPIKFKFSKFFALSLLFLLPSTLLGFMLEKMLLNLIGKFFTIIFVGTVTITFNALLYVGGNLINVDFIKTKLKKA